MVNKEIVDLWFGILAFLAIYGGIRLSMDTKERFLKWKKKSTKPTPLEEPKEELFRLNMVIYYSTGNRTASVTWTELTKDKLDEVIDSFDKDGGVMERFRAYCSRNSSENGDIYFSFVNNGTHTGAQLIKLADVQSIKYEIEKHD